MITCQLCGARWLPEDIEDHLVLDHDQDPIEVWSDGAPVIVDTTLEPGDFG